MNYPHYYKTTSKELFAAKVADRKIVSWVQGRGGAFADRLGAEPLFTRGFAPRFAGVMFTKEKPCKAPDLWTKKTDKQWLQFPLERTKDVAKHRVDALVELRKLWVEHWPAEVTNEWQSEIVKLLKLDPKQLDMGHMLTLHIRDDVMYFASSQPLVVDEVIEIIASEFVASILAPPMELVSDEQARAELGDAYPEPANDAAPAAIT